MSFLALATCKNIPEPDVDEPLLVAALERAGVPTRVLAWDDQTVDWESPRLIVVRSTWNYYRDPLAFLAWARTQGARLLNPASVIEWNLHKRYLRELAEAGLPVVPTLWFDKGSRPSFGSLFAEHAWTDVVIKPAVSAGSYRTTRLKGPPFDTLVADELVAEADAMAQPYIGSVETYGERSVVWLDGAIAHAIRKSPRFTGENEVVSDAVPIAEDERTLALAAVAHGRARGALLYARVDIVRDATGAPMLSEVEVIEPSLFLKQNPVALDRFASSIARRFRECGGG